MGKKNSPKFADIWANQTNLGKQFGLSAVAMGKKLKELNLRDENGNPTSQAIADGYCKSTPLKDGTPFFMWNKQMVGVLMESHGQQKLDPKEVKARELADNWVRVNKQYQEAVHGIEEEMCFEEAKDIKREAKRAGLTERVNEILRERKFAGELLA